jgi:chemotaxis protein methyltransferase CheR
MDLRKDQLKFFADYIERELGIIYTDSNYFQLQHRLEDITEQIGLHSTEELWAKASQGINGPLKDLLLDLATNNETSFFRDQAVFMGLQNYLIPDLFKNKPQLKELQIWSAACSSGQETYSIAMSVESARQHNPSLPDYRIVGTDFSRRMIEKSKGRSYSQLETQRGLTDDLLSRFFTESKETKNWTLNSTIPSDKFRFEQLNLLSRWSFKTVFQIIFCRNVLIYQNIENKISIINKIIPFLDTGGYLVLGAAESLLGISNDFEQISHGNAVFYKKNTKTKD